MEDDERLGRLVAAHPAGASSTVAQACAAVGWTGAVAEEMELFGQRVAVAAAVDEQAHAERVASGWEPVTDRMEVALWQWPQQHATTPPSAVALRGVLARGGRWQRVLAAAGGFAGFAATAMLLEQDNPPNEHCLITAHWYGVAVLRGGLGGGAPVLVQPGRAGPVHTARPSALTRWVEELVYARLLADGMVSVS